MFALTHFFAIEVIFVFWIVLSPIRMVWSGRPMSLIVIWTWSWLSEISWKFFRVLATNDATWYSANRFPMQLRIPRPNGRVAQDASKQVGLERSHLSGQNRSGTGKYFSSRPITYVDNKISWPGGKVYPSISNDSDKIRVTNGATGKSLVASLYTSARFSLVVSSLSSSGLVKDSLRAISCCWWEARRCRHQRMV